MIQDRKEIEGQNVFPFFVGAARSGTTLVRAMFDSHPELSIPGESGFITRLGRRAPRRYERNGTFATEIFWSDLASHRGFQRWEVDQAELRARLQQPGVQSFADAIRRIYEWYAGSHHKSRYADKTPNYVSDIPFLARLFPEAKFIHIVRDGRDVALSHLSISKWGPGTVEDAASEWRRRVEAGRRAGERLGPGRYLEVRYEDLVRDPESALKPVCDFIGLDFDAEMLWYFEKVESILGADYPLAHHQSVALPPTSNLRDWRSQMPRGQVARFEALAGSTLREMGYETRFSRIPRTTRLRAHGQLAGVRTRYFGLRIRHFQRRVWGRSKVLLKVNGAEETSTKQRDKAPFESRSS